MGLSYNAAKIRLGGTEKTRKGKNIGEVKKLFLDGFKLFFHELVFTLVGDQSGFRACCKMFLVF